MAHDWEGMREDLVPDAGGDYFRHYSVCKSCGYTTGSCYTNRMVVEPPDPEYKVLVRSRDRFLELSCEENKVIRVMES